MRIILVSTTALAMCVAGTALAQTQQSPATSAQNQNTTRTAKTVEDGLKQAGIQDIKTIDAAYLVSAKTKDGQPVTLFIDPPSAVMPSSGTSNGSGGSNSSGANSPSGQQAMSGQQQVRDALQKAGFTDVNVLDAAYLMRGKTKSGDQVTLMVDPTMTTGTTNRGMSSSGNSGNSAGHSGTAAGSASSSSSAATPGQPMKK